MRNLISAIVISAGLATLPASAAQAQDQDVCVLVKGKNAVCGAAAQGMARGALAARVYQHPFYEGSVWSIYLPDGRTRCTAVYERGELEVWIRAGTFWDNRISSIRTANHCDVKLFDDNYTSGTSTGWYDYCERLSLISGACNVAEGRKIPFDNRAGSFAVS